MEKTKHIEPGIPLLGETKELYKARRERELMEEVPEDYYHIAIPSNSPYCQIVMTGKGGYIRHLIAIECALHFN